MLVAVLGPWANNGSESSVGVMSWAVAQFIGSFGPPWNWMSIGASQGWTEVIIQYQDKDDEVIWSLWAWGIPRIAWIDDKRTLRGVTMCHASRRKEDVSKILWVRPMYVLTSQTLSGIITWLAEVNFRTVA